MQSIRTPKTSRSKCIWDREWLEGELTFEIEPYRHVRNLALDMDGTLDILKNSSHLRTGHKWKNHSTSISLDYS